MKETRFYHSKKWINIRNSIYQRDNGICQMCNKIIVEKYNVDHIEKIYEDSSDFLKYDESNLQLLCIPCHNKKRKNEKEFEIRRNTDKVNDLLSVFKK